MPTTPTRATPPSTSPKPGKWPARSWALLALVFAGHAYQATRLFPTLGSIVDPASPVVMVDHAIHEHHGALGARFFREAGTTWGYDPSFMAGYPETPVWDSSSNPSILFDLLGGGGPRDYRAYKVGLFAASLLGLAAIAGGAWAAGLDVGEVAAGSALAGLYFWAGFPDALWRSGLFAFVSAACGVGLLLGLCVRFDRRGSRGAGLALAAAGAGLFFVHVTAPILAGGGALAFYATTARRHGRRWHAAILGAVALTVAVNLVWLAPLWRFRGLRTGSGLFMTTDSAWYLVRYHLAPTVDGRLGLILGALGVAGLVAWWFGGRRAAAAAYGGSIAALVALTAFGSLWEPTKTLEPLRFRVPFCFLLAVPAGSFSAMATRRLAKLAGGGRIGAFAAGLGWSVALGAGVAINPIPVRSAAWLLARARPLVVGFPAEAHVLADWLRAHTDLSARILFEDQLRLLEATDPESVHWTPLLPDLLGPESPRMFLGGLYQTAFIRHHAMAAFGDFQLGDRPIDAWTPTDIGRYCDRYNVGWVVCWSPLSRFWFDRYPGSTRVATLPRLATANAPVSGNEHEWRAMMGRAGIDVARRYMVEGEGTYAVYRVDRPRSYFLRGKGRVVAVGPNRVELADVEPDGGAAVLALHWLDTWRADPPTPLKPEPAAPDPVDFVRIEAAGRIPRLVLYNSYQRP